MSEKLGPSRYAYDDDRLRQIVDRYTGVPRRLAMMLLEERQEARDREKILTHSLISCERCCALPYGSGLCLEMGKNTPVCRKSPAAWPEEA